MPTLKIEKEITEKDINYISDALGYQEEIEAIKEVGTMKASEYFELQDKEKDKRFVTIEVLSIDEDGEMTSLIGEVVKTKNTMSRAQYIVEVVSSKINSFIYNTILEAEKKKLEEEKNKQQEQLIEAVQQDVDKTPLNVEII
ncbi:hypothetical protein BKN14_00470 [Candidatus Gracilibacteria bacterium HOT-871]|nr:hypothetical protein BKN14_00470 [Candidatus Gracilibacteria bacterium HOT-871]